MKAIRKQREAASQNVQKVQEAPVLKAEKLVEIDQIEANPARKD